MLRKSRSYQSAATALALAFFPACGLVICSAAANAVLGQTNSADARIASEAQAMPKAELDVLFDIVAECRVAAETRSREAKENCKRQLERWQVRYATKTADGTNGGLVQDKVIAVKVSLGLADLSEGLFAMNPNDASEGDVIAARRRFEAGIDELARAIRPR